MSKRWAVTGRVAKAEPDRQLVFGWASVVVDRKGRVVVDADGDWIDPDDLEEAAYAYVLESRQAGEMHEVTEGIGQIVESMVFTREKQEALGIPAGVLPVGWWVGFHVDDPEVWSRIKAGDFPAFSIGGTGARLDDDGGSMATSGS